MTNEAQQYAETISEEVSSLEIVLRGDEADGYADALSRLEMTDREDAEGDYFGLWATETLLDVSVRVDLRGSDYGTTIVMLRTVGGPRCEIIRDSHDGDAVEVLSWSGSEMGRVRLTVPNFVAKLEDLFVLA